MAKEAVERSKMPNADPRLVPVGDSAAWKEVVLEELERPSVERCKMGDIASDFTREHFSWNVIADRYDKVLEKLVT